MSGASPIRVLHSHPIWLPRTQNWMFNQARHLPNSVENHVVCEQTENLDQFNLPNLHCLDPRTRLGRLRASRVKGSKRMAQLLWLRQNCRRLKPDLVHSHFGNIGYFNSWLLRHLPVKHVVTFYGLDVNMLPQDPRWRTRYRSLFRTAHLFLCEGPHMAECLVRLGCPRGKVRVQHLGVDVEGIPFRPRSWKPGETLKVLIAATFREKKGITYALEALARVRTDIPLQVTIIGDATIDDASRAEKQKILATIDRLRLSDSIRMLGFQPQQVLMEQAYDHHVFLSPSVTAGDGDTEGGAPVVLIEMAASGMPVIATTHCDIPNVIKHGDTGWLAPERDVEALSEGLRWLVLQPDEWNSMALGARNHIEENFHVCAQGLRLKDLYAELTR